MRRSGGGGSKQSTFRGQEGAAQLLVPLQPLELAQAQDRVRAVQGDPQRQGAGPEGVPVAEEGHPGGGRGHRAWGGVTAGTQVPAVPCSGRPGAPASWAPLARHCTMSAQCAQPIMK